MSDTSEVLGGLTLILIILGCFFMIGMGVGADWAVAKTLDAVRPCSELIQGNVVKIVDTRTWVCVDGKWSEIK